MFSRVYLGQLILTELFSCKKWLPNFLCFLRPNSDSPDLMAITQHLLYIRHDSPKLCPGGLWFISLEDFSCQIDHVVLWLEWGISTPLKGLVTWVSYRNDWFNQLSTTQILKTNTSSTYIRKYLRMPSEHGT